ncbi:hypothetical protein [Ruegeria arenilitoris]|nr:hypothetical protein [Ruegeria arenilitoris]
MQINVISIFRGRQRYVVDQSTQGLSGFTTQVGLIESVGKIADF